MRALAAVTLLWLALSAPTASASRNAHAHHQSAKNVKTTLALSDGHVGKSKTELLAQRSYSQRVIAELEDSWKVAPKHATCWSHVPWARVCDQARRRLLAHRWLYRIAKQRYDKLYAPNRLVGHVPTYFLSQAICVHGFEGAWNADTGNSFGGGLQFMVGTWNNAAHRSHGVVPYVSSTGDIARQSPQMQIYAAFVIVQADGSWREWPNTARACGLL